MSELKRDLASERFGESKVIAGALGFGVESLLLMGFFWGNCFCVGRFEVGDGIRSCKAEEVLGFKSVDSGDCAAALLKDCGIFPISHFLFTV